MNPASVGRALAWARRRAGMTQQELARAVEVPQSTVARIETGAVVPRTATLMQLLDATGHRLAIEPATTHDLDREAIKRTLVQAVATRTHRALGVRKPQVRTGPIHVLRRLRQFNVPFVLVGELAEAAHGAPRTRVRTVEVCHADTDVARERIAMALEALGDREAGPRRLRLLTRTPAGDDYDVLARTARRTTLYRGLTVRLAALEDLIRDRLATGTADDRALAADMRVIQDVAAEMGILAAR
jgi:transcriptional regulator with XRE-family HTH domain